MATSIRDLLHALEQEAPYLVGTPRQARDAAGALSELGGALQRLAYDGLELEVNGSREEIVLDLADSCAQNAVGIERDRSGRLTALAGGVADTVGGLREQVGREERWAIAAEVAAALRVVSTYAAEGDGRRTADLAWTHLTARGVATQALQDPPRPAALGVLDRPVPRPMLPPQLPASRAAMESLVVITDRLRRASARQSRRPTLLEVFAVTRAAESTARYGIVAAAIMTGRNIPDALPAAAVWYEVRDRLRPFTDAAPLTVQDRDLGMWAQRAHIELRREFGPPEQMRLTDEQRQGWKATAVVHLQAMVNEVPDLADQLAAAVEQMADHGDLHALASRLPFREYRTAEFLNRQPVVADRFDVMTVVHRLTVAGELAASVAVDLDRSTPATIERQQPGRLAAHEARVGSARIDPQAALVHQVADSEHAQEVADGMLATSRDTVALPAETDEIEPTTGSDLNIE
jgi:hypothetical protein